MQNPRPSTSSGSLPLWIALRYLLARNSALSYVSRLALLGLMLSVLVLVVVLSIVNGFERELRERVLAVLPHVTAYSESGLPADALDIVRDAGYPADLMSLAPFVSGNVLLAANGRIAAASLTGIEPDSYSQVTDIADYTGAGNLHALASTRYGVVVGERIAEELDVVIGDKVLVVLPVGGITPAGAVPRQRRFEVVDLFASNSQLDGQSVFTGLSAAQRLFRTGNRVHGVQGRLMDLFTIEPVRRFLYMTFAEHQVSVVSWKNSFGNLYQAIAVQKLTMFVLLSFLVGVAAFNLVSGLMMIVEQRQNDVAVLRTMGARTGTVVALFCCLALILSAAGIAFGLLLGAGVALGLPHLYGALTSTFELDLMSQYIIGYLPVDVRLADLWRIGLGALLMTLFASIFPAWRATRLLPSRVLAHE